MKIKITDEYHNDLKAQLNNMLLIKSISFLCVIDEFNVEEVEEVKKHWIKPDETVKVKYLTNLSLHGYNFEKKFIGVVDESVIKNSFVYKNLYELRQNWLDFKEALNAFGAKVEKITIKTEE